MRELWKQVINNLRIEIKEETYEMWFKPIEPIKMENNTLQLSVPNKFFVKWLGEKYQESLEKKVQEITGENIRLEFISQEKEKENAFSPEMIPEEEPSRYGLGSFNPKYSFQNFVIGQSNHFAHAAAKAVAQEPGRAYNPLFIYGGVGLGKTHLLHAVGQEIKRKQPKFLVLYITSEKLTNEFIDALQNRTTMEFRTKYRTLDVLLIDDIQFIAGKEMMQQEFFHLFNSLYESRKQIILTADCSPKDLKPLEERLQSRFQWGVVADIQSPDIETRVAILKKKAENEHFAVSDEVLYLIASKIKSNIRIMEGALIGIAAYSSLTGKELNMERAKEYLKTLITEEEDMPVNLEKIQQVVARHYTITQKEMISRRRNDAVAFPRMLAMYLARTLTTHSTTEIGVKFGGRDHATVMYACNRIQKQIHQDPFFNQLVNKIIKDIKEE